MPDSMRPRGTNFNCFSIANTEYASRNSIREKKTAQRMSVAKTARNTGFSMLVCSKYFHGRSDGTKQPGGVISAGFDSTNSGSSRTAASDE
jgi:hypothetical protein